MSGDYIPAALRKQVAADSDDHCGYCLASQAVSNIRLEVEHLHPTVRGGQTTRENLWLACGTCNTRKATATHATDPQTGRCARLFNPRTQRWTRHFTFDGIEIRGRTATGRATAARLQFNDPLQLIARGLWWHMGWYPPPHR